MVNFRDMPRLVDVSQVAGARLIPLNKHGDARGWLIELFRADELPDGFLPQMGYISLTSPGIVRGPHEHREQTDGFAFLSGEMELILWKREGPDEIHRSVHRVGEEAPHFALVPPGVVHAYRNVGPTDALVLNFPNQLYAGWGRSKPVDETRHELDPESPFLLP